MTLMVCLSSRTSPCASAWILSGQVAVGHRRRDLGDVAHLAGEVGGHEVDVVGEVLPRAGDAGTAAWPPSLPSVPTSRATRNLIAKRTGLVDHRVRGRYRSGATRPSAARPRWSAQYCWVRSPAATATITRATSVVGRTRSSTRPLTESSAVDQPPCAPSRLARSVMRPSRPTTRPRRTSFGRQLGVALDELVVGGFGSPTTPLRRAGRRWEKSPAAGRSHGSSRRRRTSSWSAWARCGPVAFVVPTLPAVATPCSCCPTPCSARSSYPCREVVKREPTTVPGGPARETLLGAQARW